MDVEWVEGEFSVEFVEFDEQIANVVLFESRRVVQQQQSDSRGATDESVDKPFVEFIDTFEEHLRLSPDRLIDNVEGGVCHKLCQVAMVGDGDVGARCARRRCLGGVFQLKQRTVPLANDHKIVIVAGRAHCGVSVARFPLFVLLLVAALLMTLNACFPLAGHQSSKTLINSNY